MATLGYDLISKRQTTDVERHQMRTQEQLVDAAKSSAKAGMITNAELKRLNQTTAQIAAANEKLLGLQAETLNEATKQTAIMESQLQIAQINELEKNRQNEIKQAAFSVEQRIIDISTHPSKVAKYFYYKDQLNQIDLVGLTPDSPNEISDKKYVRDILSKLQSEISSVNAELSAKEVNDVEAYYQNIIELAEARAFSERLTGTGLSGVPGAPNFVLRLLIHTIWPTLSGIKLLNLVILVPYLFLTAGGLLTGVYQITLLFWAIGAASYGLVWKKAKREYETELGNYQRSTELANQTKAQADEEVKRLELFFAQFKRDYALPE
jgi:hypothetical protein